MRTFPAACFGYRHRAQGTGVNFSSKILCKNYNKLYIKKKYSNKLQYFTLQYRLKERKEKKRDEYFKLKEEDKADLQKITKEIEEDNKMKIVKVRNSVFLLIKNQGWKNVECLAVREFRENNLTICVKQIEYK